MKIIKRDGSKVNFDIKKIQNALTLANEEVEEKYRISEEEILEISEVIEAFCKNKRRTGLYP